MRHHGQVVGIFICAEAGKPMQSVDKVRAMAKRGLAGDRYAIGAGAFPNTRNGVRHVTLFSLEELVEANAYLKGKGLALFQASETRRNILVRGIRLDALIGKTFSVGAVTMRGIESADPCTRPSTLAGKKGFVEAFEGRGGLRAEIIAGSMIYCMDNVLPY